MRPTTEQMIDQHVSKFTPESYLAREMRGALSRPGRTRMDTATLTRNEMLRRIAELTGATWAQIEAAADAQAESGDGDYHATLSAMYEAAETIALTNGFGEYDITLTGGYGDYDDDYLALTDYSASERASMAKSGHALPDGSFPVRNVRDLHNAARLVGHAHDPAAAKRHVRKMAKALGVDPDDLPGMGSDADEDDEAAATARVDALAETISLTQKYPDLMKVDPRLLSREATLIEQADIPAPVSPAASRYQDHYDADPVLGLTQRDQDEANHHISRYLAAGGEIAAGGSGLVALSAGREGGFWDDETDRLALAGSRTYTSNAGSVSVYEEDVTVPTGTTYTSAEVERLLNLWATMGQSPLKNTTGNTVIAPGPMSDWNQRAKTLAR